ncbi:MAG TPA: hypothetical protein DD808_07180 [Halieaceae bacterium]|jgi:hypothetical protein|uniref:hypothetical protein n=1 Tax=Haliea sp. TaxID=1932666 RepID=UPI000C4AE056|nr:hypothetical protein [Haliea sp.]HBQ40338.1 hypothetical protein [Halieaceae bacterium]MAD63444.1 hypothetical protein [Haliea sp.]MAY93488.1 hypothetical protein [Haliea sp.]MBK41247.1 hypothetical protein [Haliea sp.]MBP71804.1 hypothetical protein [Haliea sp.]|tara:strand:+ start:4076 stop:4657 length:582 start_codon:yes stop_codon:yes gene_type:complete
MDQEILEFIEMGRKEHQERVFFAELGLGAEVHWFFTQAVQALKSELYLPACTSFLNGIEASLRVMISQVENPARLEALDPVKTLSNRLLKSAHEAGLPVEALAFPEEDNFLERLESKKPNHVNAEVVRVRHNLCHGNILEYINTDLGDDNAFFTPECCGELSNILHKVSRGWAEQLGVFRRGLFNGKRPAITP